MSSPSIEGLLKLRKDDLIEIGNRLELEIKKSYRKTQLAKIIAEHMVDNDVFDDEVLSQFPVETPELSQSQVEIEKARIEARARTEAAKVEAETARLEAETRAKTDVEIARIAQETQIRELDYRREASQNEFDVTKQVRLVPPFSEEDIDKYLLQFEKVASNLGWPVDAWPTLLQTALKGKAQEAYAALSIEDSADYETVKAAILKAYELVPEAYRQKFRNYRKSDSETFVEFFRRKEHIFNRWSYSKNVESSYHKLKQLILAEEFRRCVPDNIKLYLDLSMMRIIWLF